MVVLIVAIPILANSAQSGGCCGGSTQQAMSYTPPAPPPPPPPPPPPTGLFIDPASLSILSTEIGGTRGGGGGGGGGRGGSGCLAKGTLIDTPNGLVPVEQLRKGMAVWTLDDSGNRIAALVLETNVRPVPLFWQMIRVQLNDGRMITASPGHPTSDGRVFSDYKDGDTLDGGLVVGLEYVDYTFGITYDLLPSSSRGLYWANQILLKSTLASH